MRRLPCLAGATAMAVLSLSSIARQPSTRLPRVCTFITPKHIAAGLILNICIAEMLQIIERHLLAWEIDDSVEIVLITSACAKAFCAGKRFCLVLQTSDVLYRW